jgi:uncharacterized protein (TIGR03083 family)
MNQADAYQRAYRRILSLVNENVAGVEVPTCPGWTVKDVVAHCAGFFTAYKSGDPKEAFGPGWGDREVEARRERSLEECVTEWSDLVAEPGDLFESHLAGVAVSDVLAHEQDIRTAINQPGGEDDENIVPAVEMALAFLEKKAETKDLPALRFITDDIDHKVGHGEPVATLHTSTFELFRAVQGRRTVDQVRAMPWRGDPSPWLPDLFVFGPAERTVEG